MENEGGMELSEGNNNVPMWQRGDITGQEEEMTRGGNQEFGLANCGVQVGGGRSTPGVGKPGHSQVTEPPTFQRAASTANKTYGPSVRTIVGKLIRNILDAMRTILFDSRFERVEKYLFSFFREDFP